MPVEREWTGKGKGKGNVRLTAQALETLNFCAAHSSEHARRQPWAARQSALAWRPPPGLPDWRPPPGLTLEPSWVQRERDSIPAVCAEAKANAKSSPKANAKTAPTSKAKAAPPTAHYRQPHAAATLHGQPSAASSSASSSMNNGPLVTLPWQQFEPLHNGSCRCIDPQSMSMCPQPDCRLAWTQHQERLAMTPAPRYSA
jgi:hypothetical protein